MWTASEDSLTLFPVQTVAVVPPTFRHSCALRARLLRRPRVLAADHVHALCLASAASAAPRPVSADAAALALGDQKGGNPMRRSRAWVKIDSDGYINLPGGPGLGVELDIKAVEKAGEKI